MGKVPTMILGWKCRLLEDEALSKAQALLTSLAQRSQCAAEQRDLAPQISNKEHLSFVALQMYVLRCTRMHPQLWHIVLPALVDSVCVFCFPEVSTTPMFGAE